MTAVSLTFPTIPSDFVDQPPITARIAALPPVGDR
jgi:hypothetical protein